MRPCPTNDCLSQVLVDSDTKHEVYLLDPSAEQAMQEWQERKLAKPGVARAQRRLQLDFFDEEYQPRPSRRIRGVGPNNYEQKTLQKQKRRTAQARTKGK